LSGHKPRGLEIVGVIANDDAKFQLSCLKDWNFTAGLVDRPADRRIQLAIQAHYRSSLKDRCGVVEPAVVSQLGESNDRRHRIAGEGAKYGIELTSLRGNRVLAGIFTVVRQSSENCFWATQN